MPSGRAFLLVFLTFVVTIGNNPTLMLAEGGDGPKAVVLLGHFAQYTHQPSAS